MISHHGIKIAETAVSLSRTHTSCQIRRALWLSCRCAFRKSAPLARGPQRGAAGAPSDRGQHIVGARQRSSSSNDCCLCNYHHRQRRTQMMLFLCFDAFVLFAFFFARYGYGASRTIFGHPWASPQHTPPTLFVLATLPHSASSRAAPASINSSRAPRGRTAAAADTLTHTHTHSSRRTLTQAAKLHPVSHRVHPVPCLTRLKKTN